MDQFYKQDIFFFVTTIAVVIFTIFFIVASVYVVKILNDIKYISKKAKTESDLIAQDLNDLRNNVKTGGSKLMAFTKFFTSFYKRRK